MSRRDVESHLPLSQAQFHVLSAFTEGELHGDAIVQLVEDDQRRRYYRLTGLGQLVWPLAGEHSLQQKPFADF